MERNGAKNHRHRAYATSPAEAYSRTPHQCAPQAKPRRLQQGSEMAETRAETTPKQEEELHAAPQQNEQAQQPAEADELLEAWPQPEEEPADAPQPRDQAELDLALRPEEALPVQATSEA